MKNNEKTPENIIKNLVEIDELIALGVLPVGKFVTVETINPIYHGRLVGVTASYYLLSECSWLGDCGQRADYESGTPPAEANFMGGTEKNPVIIERSSCVLGPCLAPIQNALSQRPR